MGIGKSHDEVYQYGGEWEGVFDGQRGESGYRGVCIHFGCLAVSTSRDKLSKEGGHSRPPIVSLHPVKGLEESFMSPGGGFVEHTD